MAMDGYIQHLTYLVHHICHVRGIVNSDGLVMCEEGGVKRNVGSKRRRKEGKVSCRLTRARFNTHKNPESPDEHEQQRWWW